MGDMIGVAVYVCTTDSRRTKRFPFSVDMECPRLIEDVDTGDVFQLVARHYEVDAATTDALDAQAARVREWNARHFGGKAA